jgi:hypothetical protein
MPPKAGIFVFLCIKVFLAQSLQLTVAGADARGENGGQLCSAFRAF